MDTIRFVRDNFDMTILLIEHDMKLVSGICEELTVLNFGHVLRQGKTSDVLHDPEVIKAYLGELGGETDGITGSTGHTGLYGMIQALKGVSFSVNEGEVIALIGANGAGKTTTLHTVTGLLRANQDILFMTDRISQRFRLTKS